MKPSLGRLGLVWLLMVASLHAAQYSWSVVKAPKSLYVGESDVVQYRCSFDGSAAEYTVEFKPSGNEQYKASMVTQSDRVEQGKRILTFDVLITPMVAGVINVKQNALIRHTTFASIENATIGRDNVKKYDFNDEKAILPSVPITAMANTAALSGEITLSVQVDKFDARTHEPVHLSVYVRGYGNLNQYVPYELNISGVKVFSQEPQKALSLTQRGYEGEIRQEFALVASKSYVIPPLVLNVFDTKTHTTKRLQSKPIRIAIGSGYEPSNLLDAPDLTDTATLKQYGIYGLFMILGMMLGEAVRWIWKWRPERKSGGFWDEAKTAKELSVLLAMQGNRQYDPIIQQLDEGTLELKEAKKRVITLAAEENR